MSAPRTRSKLALDAVPPDDHAVPDEPVDVEQGTTLPNEQQASAKMTTDARLNAIDAHLHAILHELRWRNEATIPMPLEATASKVYRRRTLDEMNAAMSRLLSPEPRPRDDDSPRILYDAITELILQRQLVSDLMQAATSSYQHGLAAIRKMTER